MNASHYCGKGPRVDVTVQWSGTQAQGTPSLSSEFWFYLCLSPILATAAWLSFRTQDIRHLCRKPFLTTFSGKGLPLILNLTDITIC